MGHASEGDTPQPSHIRPSGTCTANLVLMTAPQRRARSTRVDPSRVAYIVSAEHKAKFEAIAHRAGVTASLFYEKLVDHMVENLTPQGLPEWWPAPDTEGELPFDQEETPISAA